MSTESIPLELTMEIPIFNLKGSTFIIMKRQVTALSSNAARKISICLKICYRSFAPIARFHSHEAFLDS